MVSDIFLIVSCYANAVSQIFFGLDNVKIDGISILDIFCAIWFFHILVWFIEAMINIPYDQGGAKEGPVDVKK